MSTIREIVFRIHRKLDGGFITDDSKYTYRELRGYVVSGIANALKQSYLEQRNLEDFKYGDDTITTSYKTSVLTDAETGLKYVALANTTISIAGGRFTLINSVNPVGKFARIYAPIRLEERIVVANQPCIPNLTYYYKENDRAYFYGEQTTEAEVYVSDRYAIPSDDDAELNMPVEFENQVILSALQILAPTQFPQDLQNNGKPN